MKLAKFFLICLIYLNSNLTTQQQQNIPTEILKDMFSKVTDEIQAQLMLNLNKASISKRDVKQNVTTNTKANPFVGKTSPDSIKLHQSFMKALKESKKLLKSGAHPSTIKLKAAPQFCPFQFSFSCDEKSKYRQVDGSCNNLDSPLLGKSSTPFKRFINETSYDDKLNDPRKFGINGSPLPNPRSISLLIHDPSDIPANMTNLGVMLGQFIDHDFAQSAGVSGSDGQVLKCTCDSFDSDCINIVTPDDDFFDNDQTCMTVTRSSASFSKFNCESGAREQTNLLTHFLDMSGLYGNDENQQTKLRSFFDGLLKSTVTRASSKRFLPFTNPGACSDERTGQLCFESGDPRTNQNMMLVSIHTLWMREHNRVATALQEVNPNWSDENIFQETKRIVIAEYQNVIYSEWLPVIVGTRLMEFNQLRPLREGFFLGYDKEANPNLAAEFSTAAFRFGHTLLRSFISKADRSMRTFDNLTLSSIMFKNREAYTNGGLDSICRGLLFDPATNFDGHITNEIQNHLFETNAFDAQTRRFSLSAINIMRGRDHGIPPYNSFRVFSGLQRAKSFEELFEMPPDAKDKLKRLYDSVEDIDAFTGGLSEQSMEDAILGPTFAFIVAKQFRDLKIGDRYYFENGDNPVTRFTLPQLNQIRKSSMAGIMCENLDLEVVQRNAFRPISDTNPLVSCSSLHKVKINRWRNEPLPQ